MLTDWLKGAGAVLALIGSVWGGTVYLENHFQTVADAAVQFAEVKQLYLQSEHRGVRRQIFELENTKSQRPLTPLEDRRLKELYDELRLLDEQIKQFAPPKPTP